MKKPCKRKEAQLEKLKRLFTFASDVQYNVAVGYHALSCNTTGSQSTRIGISIEEENALLVRNSNEDTEP